MGGALLSLVLALAALVFAAGPASATGLQATVLSPISGSISSAPSEPHHRPYGGDYSYDVAGQGTVYARFRNPNGNLTLSVAAPPSRACGSGVFADGGDKIVLNVFINGQKVGTVTYAHLTGFPITSGNVPVGAAIGRAVTNADGVFKKVKADGSYCWGGPHVHVEPRNDVRYGCAIAGLRAGAGPDTALGIIGGERATGPNQYCGPNPETPTAVDSDGDGLSDPADSCPALRGPGFTGGCPDTNLVKGGGFETGGWSASPNTNFVTYANGQVSPGENARSGSRYAATNTSVSGGGIRQDIAIPIAVGDTYCANAFVRSQSGGTASGSLALWMLGGTSENGARGIGSLGVRDDWAPVATCVTATQPHSALRVEFYPKPNGGTLNIDDVNVARSLVKGGGFETSGWSASSNTNFVTYTNGQVSPGENARSGTRYAATNTSVSGGGIRQDVAIPIAVGDTYCVSAFVRSQSGGTASGSLALWMLGGTSENGARGFSGLGTKDNWKPTATCVTATQAHSALRVEFYPKPNGGTINVDDVSVARSLAKGGGFETGGWLASPSTNFVTYGNGQAAAGENARSGTKYAATNTTISGGGIYQDIAVPIGVGDTYCASAFVRSQTGGTASGTFTLWMIGGTSENGSHGYGRLGTKDNWTPLATCVTATQPHSALRVQFYPNRNGGTTQIDDVAFGNAADLTGYPLHSVTRPAISGTSRVGARLTAATGAWSPSPSAFTYRWYANGTAITGATASTYTPTAASVGKRITVRVTASRTGYSSSAMTSSPTATVAKGTITNTTRPSIAGTRKVGYTLTARVGTWTPGGLTHRYQWRANGVSISGATTSRLALRRALRGKKITVVVTASRVGYISRAALSANTAAIQ